MTSIPNNPHYQQLYELYSKLNKRKRFLYCLSGHKWYGDHEYHHDPYGYAVPSEAFCLRCGRMGVHGTEITFCNSDFIQDYLDIQNTVYGVDMR